MQPTSKASRMKASCESAIALTALTKPHTLYCPQPSRCGHSLRPLPLMHAGTHHLYWPSPHRSLPAGASSLSKGPDSDKIVGFPQTRHHFTQEQHLRQPADPPPFPQATPPQTVSDNNLSSSAFCNQLGPPGVSWMHPLQANPPIPESFAPPDNNDPFNSYVQSLATQGPTQDCIDPRDVSQHLPHHSLTFLPQKAPSYINASGLQKALTGPASPKAWGLDQPDAMQLLACGTPSSSTSEEDDYSMSDAALSDNVQSNRRAPYNQLLHQCLMEEPTHELMLKDIYTWFEKHTDKPQDSKTQGWQNSIRHNLSMNPAFQRGPRTRRDAGVANMWSLSDQAIQQGVEPTTRFRLQNRRATKKKSRRAISRRISRGARSSASVASAPASVGGSPMIRMRSSPGVQLFGSQGGYTSNLFQNGASCPPSNGQNASDPCLPSYPFADQVRPWNNALMGNNAENNNVEFQHDGMQLDPRLHQANDNYMSGWPGDGLSQSEPQPLTEHTLFQHNETYWPRGSQRQEASCFPQHAGHLPRQGEISGQTFSGSEDVPSLEEAMVCGMHEDAKGEPLFTGGSKKTSSAGQEGAQTPGDYSNGVDTDDAPKLEHDLFRFDDDTNDMEKFF